MSKTTKKINLIAPILRMLLTGDNGCPIIRFAEESSCKETAIKVTLPEDVKEERAIEVFTAVIKQSAQQIRDVCVEGCGVFEILYPPKKLTGRVLPPHRIDQLLRRKERDGSYPAGRGRGLGGVGLTGTTGGAFSSSTGSDISSVVICTEAVLYSGLCTVTETSGGAPSHVNSPSLSVRTSIRSGVMFRFRSIISIRASSTPLPFSSTTLPRSVRDG